MNFSQKVGFMRYCLRLSLIAFLILGAREYAIAQANLEKEKPHDRIVSHQIKWKESAQRLTKQLLEDAPQLEEFDRAILFARLGNVWFKRNPIEARNWLINAVEIIGNDSQISDKSSAKHLRRIAACREIFRLVFPLDGNLSDRILKALENDKDNRAEALVDATALALEQGNLTKGVELWRAALHAGGVEARLVTLLIQVRKLDAGIADVLFDEALILAPNIDDSRYYWAFAETAFPETLSLPKKLPTPPDALRARFLQVLAGKYIVTGGLNADREKSCQLTPVVLSLLDFYTVLLPPRSIEMRFAINNCRTSLSSLQKQQSDDLTSDGPLKSADDFVIAAHKISDKKIKAVYLAKAAQRSRESGDYERACSLLDEIDDREPLGESWKLLRQDSALLAAIKYAKNKDYYRMKMVLDLTPKELRYYVNLGIINELMSKGDRTNIFELLRSARTALADAESMERVYGNLKLVEIYARLIPSEIGFILSDLAASLNQLQDIAETKSAKNKFWEPLKLPAISLEVNELETDLALASIKQPIHRVSIRFGLLASTIEKIPNQIEKEKNEATTIKSKAAPQ